MGAYSLNFFQINAQHSRTATNNLIQLINEQSIDIICIQEPYSINTKLPGIPKSMRTYACGDGRRRAAIIISNHNIDATLIRQYSDEDCIIIEVNYNGEKFYTASMYFDRERNIETDIRKVETVLDHIKGSEIIIASDTNARNTIWYNVENNERGRVLEEFITTTSLHITNENTGIPTFETRRAKSWVDLTMTNNHLLAHVTEWNCGVEESCADHKIIAFTLDSKTQRYAKTFRSIKYIKNTNDYAIFDALLEETLKNTLVPQKRS